MSYELRVACRAKLETPLFTWGTPLAQSDEIIRIPIRPRILSEIALALVAISMREM